MPRMSRLALAVLVTLVVIIGIYSSVEGLGTAHEKVGSHYVSSTLINPNYYRAATTDRMPMQLDQQHNGHNCNSDAHAAPDD